MTWWTGSYAISFGPRQVCLLQISSGICFHAEGSVSGAVQKGCLTCPGVGPAYRLVPSVTSTFTAGELGTALTDSDFPSAKGGSSFGAGALENTFAPPM